MSTAAAGPGLSPVREVLPGGAVVLVKETRTVPSVAINAVVHAGSAYDPPALPGLGHFTARVVDRGTRTRSAELIAEEFDSRGVTLNVAVNRQIVTLSCTCLAEDFEPLLALVAEILRQPAFPEDETARRRIEILTLIRQDEDNPFVVALETLLSLLYDRGHPFGHTPHGTAEAVTRADRAALVTQHQRLYVPAALSLAIVGDVRAERAIDLAGRAFGDWAGAPRAADAVPPAPPATTRRRSVVSMMNKAQADIAYGFTTMRRRDPAYYAAWIMNNVLGQYGLGGRLGDSIRERQGMAYYAFSSFEPNVIEGPLIVRAGVSAANVDRAIASIDEEVARMAAEGITAKELAEAKQYLTGSLPRRLETNEGIASFLQNVEHFGLGLDHDRQLPALIDAVTLEDVGAAAARLLDIDRAAVVIAGPYPPPA